MKHEIIVKTTLLETFYVECENREKAIELVQGGDCIPDYNEILDCEILEVKE
jgi:hypothetical protein